MNAKLRVLGVFAGLSIMLGACSSAPGGSGAAASPNTPTCAAPGGGAATANAALKGSLTIWHSYGSGAGTEACALKEVTDKIKAANPDLKLTIQDVKFDDLFKKFELEGAAAARGSRGVPAC